MKKKGIVKLAKITGKVLQHYFIHSLAPKLLDLIIKESKELKEKVVNYDKDKQR